MSECSLDERYLTWLYGQVANVKTRARARTHWSLFRQLHRTEFIALVPHDENRIEDAIDLRYEFLHDEDEQGEDEFLSAPCSMLELLFILSEELAFEMDDDARIWFWHLVEVLDLERFNDRYYDDDAEEVIDKTLHRVIHRTYSNTGKGGLFPLKRPTRDQRKVELWYQLNAYLLENF